MLLLVAIPITPSEHAGKADTKDLRAGTRANTLYVGPGQNYTNIQDAINAAEDGDTVRVYAGTYNEHIKISKQISLIGNGSSYCNINGVKSEVCINVLSDYVTLSGFQITNNAIWHYPEVGIELNQANYCRIENNTITQCKDGIELTRSSNTDIVDNNIFSNFDRGLIFQDFSENNIIIHNVITINNGSGIDDFSAYNNYFNNTISSNRGTGIYASSHNSIIQNNNILCNKRNGISVRSGRNLIQGNNISSCSGYGFYIHCDNNTIESNTVYSNGQGGFFLEFSCYNQIDGNSIINNNGDGVTLVDYSDHNTISNNIIRFNQLCGISSSESHGFIVNNIVSENKNGIYINSSWLNTVANNYVDANIEFGITIQNSIANTLANNTVSNNSKGIYLITVGDRMLNNSIISNTEYGLYLNRCRYNILLYNNFIGNTEQAIDDVNTAWPTSGNLWHDGVNGNFWSNWTSPDKDNDGIVDKPYLIRGTAGAKDYNPLAKQNCVMNTMPVDSDHDTLYDKWEMKYFSDLSYSGEDNPDGDSYPNNWELENGLDPTHNDDTTSPSFWEKYWVFIVIPLIVIVFGLLLLVLLIFYKKRAKSKKT